MLFCTIAPPNEPGVQKRTVCVRNCNIAGRDAEMVQKSTPHLPHPAQLTFAGATAAWRS